MALDIRVEDGLPITVEQARDFIQNESNTFGLYFDLDRILEYELLHKKKAKYHLGIFTKMVGGDIRPTQYEKVRVWFQEYFGIPDRLMLNKAHQIAFDAPVRQNLLQANIDEEAKEFIRNYNLYTLSNKRVSYLKQYLQLPLCYELSTEGHRMVVAHPQWEILSTSRLAANSPSLQNIARDMSDIICCPKGWILVRADSGQIEPRITYSHYINDPIIRDLIILYNDAYFGQLHYCQLPEDVYQNRNNLRVSKPGESGNDPNVIYAKEVADEFKEGREALKVLSLAATYGSGLTGQDPVLAKRYIDRIVNHPDRKRWEAEVTAQVERGVEVFYSVFGSKITPDETDRYKKYMSTWTSHVVRCGINNPIQTTASDLMIHSVNRAREILSKARGSHVAFYKHDEGAFYIHESEKSLVSELEGITAYNVTENGRPWIPIGSEVEFGQLRNNNVPSVLEWSEEAC